MVLGGVPMPTIEARSLEWIPSDWDIDCDGCRNVIREGDLYLTGIASCCGGGCVRNLCEACVAAAALALERIHAND